MASMDDDTPPDRKRKKLTRKGPHDIIKKMAVVLREGVVFKNKETNEVFMPTAITMSNEIKPDPGLRQEILFNKSMTPEEIKEVLKNVFPILANTDRFFCAKAVQKVKLDFCGEPRIWSGEVLNREIKGHSVLFIYCEEENSDQHPSLLTQVENMQISRNVSSPEDRSDSNFKTCTIPQDISRSKDPLLRSINMTRSPEPDEYRLDKDIEESSSEDRSDSGFETCSIPQGERLSSNYAEQALSQQLTAGEIKLPEDASSERLERSLSRSKIGDSKDSTSLEEITSALKDKLQTEEQSGEDESESFEETLSENQAMSPSTINKGKDSTSPGEVISVPVDKQQTEEQSGEDESESFKETLSVGPATLDHDIKGRTITFEAMHKECIRVLPYEDTNCQVYVQLYVFCDKNDIPKELKGAAQEFFGETGVKLKWTNLYNYASNKPNIVSEDFKQLEVSQVNYIGDIIKRNLPVFSKHRNITAIQPSLKVTNSKQTNDPCIRVYVLGKGCLPFDESEIPNAVENCPVDIVDGFWLETSGTPKPLRAHKQGEYLRLGASIEVKGTGNGGTLGAIVKDDDGRFYILSCDHVMRSVIGKEIIHPAKNHYSTSLKYHLIVYHNWINRIFNQRDTFQHNHPDSVEYFQQLERRVESFYSGRYRHPKLRECEGKLRKLISEPPRTVAYFIDGICENRGDFYTDAAVAKLTNEEIEALKRNGYVEIIDTEDYPDGSVTKEDSQNEKRQWRKSGSSTGYTSLKTEFSLNCVYLRKSARERPSSTSGGFGSSDFEWCKKCIVLKNEKNNLFSQTGDSGAVVFEKPDQQLPAMPGFGIVIGNLVTSNEGASTIAIPLFIALDQLSEKLGSRLTLVSAL